MMAATNIRNLKINIRGNIMHIHRRKGTQNLSPMPPDPKEKRGERHVLSQRIPFGIRMHAKKLDLMSQILQQNNLGDHIPEGAKKKKREYPNSNKGNSSHALISINSSLDAWIIDSRESHHMDASKEIYYSLDACKVPPILMGDNSSVKVTDKGRIELTNESFENVLHVPKLYVNLLSMYHIKNS
jgi:hypothetical protein